MSMGSQRLRNLGPHPHLSREQLSLLHRQFRLLQLRWLPIQKTATLWRPQDNIGKSVLVCGICPGPWKKYLIDSLRRTSN